MLAGMAAGLLAGLIVAWLVWLKTQAARAVLTERLDARDNLLAARDRQLADLRDECADLQQINRDLETAQARLQALWEEERRSGTEKIRVLNEARESFRQEFENLANRILEAKSRSFSDFSRQALEQLLVPVREQLDQFRARVDAVHTEQTRDQASLLSEIQHLKTLNQQISQEAVNLTKALKGESKTRGNWGELVLEQVLEHSGLTRGREYDTQVGLGERFGGPRNRYPDFVVHLPEGKDVIIDSKVILNAYARYCAANTAAEREAALAAHVTAVRAHAAALGAKDYGGLAGIRSLDLVIMCIPVEAAYIAAVAHEPQLYDDALKNRVLLVGPSTLLLALRIIATIWKREQQDRNAYEIAERGRLLYEKFAGFAEDLGAIGKSLAQAQESFDAAVAKLSRGPGNLIGQAQKLCDLGIKPRKQLPAELADRDRADEAPPDRSS